MSAPSKPSVTLMRLQMSAAAAALLLALAAPAQAHHAFNMYDGTTRSMTGTVKSFTWKNPHAMIEFVATMPDGTTETWIVECSAPNIIGRRGWNKDSLKAGDKVPMVIHPMKDGSKYGLLVTVTRPDGAVLKDKT